MQKITYLISDDITFCLSSLFVKYSSNLLRYIVCAFNFIRDYHEKGTHPCRYPILASTAWHQPGSGSIHRIVAFVHRMSCTGDFCEKFFDMHSEGMYITTGF